MNHENYVVENGNIIVLETPKRLEGRKSLEFRKLIMEVVEKNYVKIVVDLSKTTFIDSNGISSLVSRIAASRSKHGDIRLANLSPFVKDVLSTTHLDKVFACYDSVKAALNSFSQPWREGDAG